MSRGLTDPVEEPEIPSSNDDIMGVVLMTYMLVESLHQRLDLAGIPVIPLLNEVVEDVE